MEKIKKKLETMKIFFRGEALERSADKVAAENYRMLILVDFAIFLFSTGLLGFAIFGKMERMLVETYSYFLVASIVIWWILHYIVKVQQRLIPLMIVVEYVVVNIYLLRIGIIYHNDSPATSFYIFLALSFCFLMKPKYLVMLQLFCGGLFAITSILMKPYTASYLDVLNTIMMVIISCVLGCNILNFRMTSMRKLEQRDHALKVSQLYHSILDETQTGIAVHDIQTGEIFYGNEKMKEIYGISGDVAELKQDSVLYQERGRKHINLDIDALRNGETTEATEYHRASGRFYQVKGKRIDWYGREAYVEYLSDITDSRRFNEQLRHAHEELQKKYQEALLYRENAVSDDVIASSRINLTHGYIEEMRIGTEEGFEKQYLYAVDLLTRASAFTRKNWILPEQARRMTPEHLLEGFANGKTRFAELYAAELKDGKHAWVKTEVTLVERPETADIIAFSYSRNVTRENELSHILEKIMSFEYDEIYIIDSINGSVSAVAKGVYALDNHMKDGTYEDKLESLKVRTKTEEDRVMLGKKLNLNRICRKLEKSNTYVKEVPLRSKSGFIRLKQLRYMYLDNTIGTILFTMKDIDAVVKEEKAKQERLQMALHMAEAANATKTNFLASMSHEIRTPMNAIIGLASIMKEEASNEQTVLECTDKLDSASRYLLSLLNDILDMSKIESGNVMLQKQRFKTATLWESVNTLAMTQARSAGITYIFESKKELSEAYIGDTTRLQQIFINLINNAMKFTPSGGTVKVTVSEEETVKGRVHLKVTVSDTGIGISKEFLPKLFEAFMQEHDGRTSVYGGSGLGLSIAKSYANLMGGDINVESELGKGTTFIVEVWLDMVEEAKRALKKVTKNVDEIDELTFVGKRILLAEDHPLNTMVATRLLEKKGMIVVHAENGKKAVDMIETSEEFAYDAILMDIRMPVMDGIEAAKAIRELDRADTKVIPIIAMTANAYDEDRKMTSEAGMNDHLAKPIETQLLYQTLYKYMAK